MDTETKPEVEIEVVTHWGCALYLDRPDNPDLDGRLYIVRWDPGYGSGTYLPYIEAEARADVARAEPGFRKGLVTRTQTTTIVTTPWKEAS